MSDVFINSRGREVFADDVVPAVEDGYFAIFIKNKKVLLYWPPYGEAAEFIGGVCPRAQRRRGGRLALVRGVLPRRRARRQQLRRARIAQNGA